MNKLTSEQKKKFENIIGNLNTINIDLHSLYIVLNLTEPFKVNTMQVCLKNLSEEIMELHELYKELF